MRTLFPQFRLTCYAPSPQRLQLLGAGFIAAVIWLLLAATTAQAAPIVHFPITVTQPDGTQLVLYVSGDEFYNWTTDANEFTVMQDPTTGYYVYADLVKGVLVPTKLVPGKDNPATAGLQPKVNISGKEMAALRQQKSAGLTAQGGGDIQQAPHSGTIVNPVIFIRFAGETEFSDSTATYDNLFNNATAGYNSLHNYYEEVSYGTLAVDSVFRPTPGSTVISYPDSHPRSYFQPYNAATNPGGYTSSANARIREHTLLRDAIAYVNGLGQFPSGAQLDGDSDGFVDSITFVIYGSPGAWADLLWPHMWNLSTYNVLINGKQVDNYAFQLQNHMVAAGTGVLAHEMFHVLGAPDLYHYTTQPVSPVGKWDLMEQDQNPPQHMGCYMKYKYGHWIGTIPTLTPGTYALNPLTSATNNCFKMPSPFSASEFFVVEYRNTASGHFEGSLPGSGLLVYRINPAYEGNAYGPPDEVYIYRPGGTTTVNGSVNQANYSSDVGRTAINHSTTPSSFLTNGSTGGLSICNVGSIGSTISFQYGNCNGTTISGNAGAGGVTLTYTDGTTKTATSGGDGSYSFTVSDYWSGTVTPSLTGYVFDPPSRTYTRLTSNQTNQNYSTGLPYQLSGSLGTDGAGATINYTGGSTVADSSGHYTITVISGWTGTITPSKPGFAFTPPSISISTGVTTDLTGLDFVTSPSRSVYLPFVAANPAVALLQNGSFELGTTPWTWSGAGLVTATWAYDGSHFAWLGGYDHVATDLLYQTVNIPAGTNYVRISYHVAVASDENNPSGPWDFLYVSLQPVGSVTRTEYPMFDNNDQTSSAYWYTATLTYSGMSAYAGTAMRVYFRATTDSSNATSFFVDGVSVQASPGPFSSPDGGQEGAPVTIHIETDANQSRFNNPDWHYLQKP